MWMTPLYQTIFRNPVFFFRYFTRKILVFGVITHYNGSNCLVSAIRYSGNQ
jgi:hypothetical protein